MRRGATLLEVLVALVVLTTAGVSAIGQVAAHTVAVRRMEAREREFRDADKLLLATSLLTRPELDLRIGQRVVGEMSVQVGRPEPTVYRIGVARAAAPTIELLATLVYRPEDGP